MKLQVIDRFGRDLGTLKIRPLAGPLDAAGKAGAQTPADEQELSRWADDGGPSDPGR